MFKGISYKNIDRKNERKKDNFHGDGMQHTAL